MKKLIYSTSREGYGVDQINRTMTAGELINFLAQYDEDTPIYLSFDNGYSFMPDVAIPSMKYFWQQKNRTSTGTIALAAAAIVMLNSCASSEK